MKQTVTFLFFIMVLLPVAAQTTLSGQVTDKKGYPIATANVYIEGTYDGAVTNSDGNFSFTTQSTGMQTMVITFLTFGDVRESISIEDYKPTVFILKPSENTLDAVVISAGTFSAGDNTKVNALNALDIVTTAGSAGNIIAALQTLPGTQTVGEDGRLFVRGGEADETQTFIDGVRVAQPYGATANNVPARGRFSPFLFKGMTFSTGGYSAEYGEALSSVLLLNTIDEADQDKTEISVMTAGLALGNTQKWEKSSLSFNGAYMNLQPYQWLVPQKLDWNKPYQNFSGESVYRYHFNSGLLKVYTAFSRTDFDLNQKDINQLQPARVDMVNDNLYFNTSYKGMFGTQWTINTGVSYGYSHNAIMLNKNTVDNGEHSAHLKLKLTKGFTRHFKLSFGSDYFITDFKEDYAEPTGFTFNSGYNNGIAAIYTEADILFSSKFALKAGLRGSHSDIVNVTSLEPRIALAYKAGKKGQFSLAYGDFYQTPRQDYLKYDKSPEYEKTAHYIFNYMYNGDGQTFRAESYYKSYDNLVKYNTSTAQYNSVYNNNGYGYARGIDLFWRDAKLFKNTEYWVSYSYIDSERDYKNYEKQVTPNYIATHNLSVVTKYWITSLRSQLGVTYSFNSGRPYNNPNQAAFMDARTKSYNNLSLSWAWLFTQQKIVYFSVSNVLGTNNVFDYTYADNPGADGQFARHAVTQPADRFFFVGFFWTISNDETSNQLDNL
ncbi:TonB-dependent receptor [Flavobacterium rhizosphaerae]|uniref:TonB-dependent receptor n=1 Tax=Flavobacterium rhizosphaerae TaxID=3163298 RepID=A0ABW8YVM5_9FLAO